MMQLRAKAMSETRKPKKENKINELSNRIEYQVIRNSRVWYQCIL